MKRKRTLTSVLLQSDSPKPYILVAYENNRLILFNYETHEEVISAAIPSRANDEEQSIISAISFSPQCLHLACGKSNGELWFLQPAIMAPIYVEPCIYSKSRIKKIVFSQNCIRMVYYDEDNTVFAFFYDTESEEWIFKGKVRAHYKELVNILFLDEEPHSLFSMGKDRHLIKYTTFSLNSEDIDIDTRDRIEQKDIPLYFISYPKKKFSKSGYFLEADDKHKFKVISIKTDMCTAVYLGPAYGCFEGSPVCKMEFIPRHQKKFLIFMNKNHIGLQLMPIDGNPFRFSGCLAHPEEILDFKISMDGCYIFTIGKNDRTVFMWEIKPLSVQTLFKLGGQELQPFYCLLDGGRNGFLFNEMKDLFYYMQILQQGEQVCVPRIVSNCINIVELPDLVRACGYYPSEYEIENLLTDIRYKIYGDEGVTKEQVTFCEFVKLFINHKPAYGYSLVNVEKAFDTVTSFVDDFESGEMPREDFIDSMTTTGEALNTEQIFRCMSTLFHVADSGEDQIGERDFSFMPSTIDFQVFTDEILGLDSNATHEISRCDLQQQQEQQQTQDTDDN